MAKDYVLNIVIKASDQANSVIRGVSASFSGAASAAQDFGNRAKQAGEQAKNSLDQVKKQSDQLKQKLQQVSEALVGAGTAMVGFGVALAGPMGMAVKSAGDFQHSMNKVKAVAEGTSEDFSRLGNKAREIGASSQYSATQAAGGMLELSRAGYKTEQTLSAIIPVLNLAAAEELNMGQTAEGLVNILQGFGLGADQATRAADVLSKTSNETTTSMGELVEGMKYAAPVAAAMGMSIEEASGYLGILSNAGIKGAMAGTGLRRVIERLVDPTKEAKNTLQALGVEIVKNGQGQLQLTDTFRRLAQAGMSAADAFKIFGVHGATDAIVIAKNVSGLEELTEKNNNAAGSLQQVVNTINSGVAPAFTRLKNALDEMAISFGEPFLTPVKFVVDGLANVLNWVSRLAKEYPTLSGVLAGGLGVFGLLVVVAGGLALALGGLVFALRQLYGAWQLAINIKNQGIAASIRGTQAVQSETAAINANTIAKQRNAAAESLAARNQRTINALGAGSQVPILTSSRSGAVRTPPVVPEKTPGVIPTVIAAGDKMGKGSAAALGIGAAAGALAQFSGAESTLDKISGTLMTISSIAMFLPVPGARIVGLIGMAASGAMSLASAFGIGKGEAQQTADKTKEIAKAQEGVDKSTQKVIDDYIDMDKTFLEFKRDYETATGKEVTEKEVNAWRDAYDDRVRSHRKALKDINTDEQAAKAGAATGPQKSAFGANAEEIKNTFDTLVKEAESYYSQLESLRKVDLDRQKGNASASIQSQQLAKLEQMKLETDAATQKIAQADQHYAHIKRLRDIEYQESLSSIAQLDKAEQQAAGEKLEKKHADDKIADDRKYTELLIKELDSQLKARQHSIEEIRRLEAQQVSERQATTDALKQITLASSSEYDKLKINVADASSRLREAVQLMPTMPERALELAKQAQSAFASLGQNSDQLLQNMRSNAQLISDAQRSISTSGLTGAAKWKAEVEDVRTTLTRAREEAAAGRTKEAENLYKQAIGQSKSLATSAPEGMKTAAKKEASSLVSEAGKELLGLNSKQVSDAEATNARIAEGIQQAGQVVNSLIQNQIASHQANIAALERNTAALMGKIQAPSQPEAEAKGVASPEATGEQKAPFEGERGTVAPVAAASEGITNNLSEILSQLSASLSEVVAGLIPPAAQQFTTAGGAPLDPSAFTESGSLFKTGIEQFKEVINTAKDTFSKPIKVNVTLNNGGGVDMWNK
ncbi:MAG: phage tail tape measure protein [Desulfomonile tiedjei]|nr:phage tail tape measure protein [Desulfomonile tiedjei]